MPSKFQAGGRLFSIDTKLCKLTEKDLLTLSRLGIPRDTIYERLAIYNMKVAALQKGTKEANEVCNHIHECLNAYTDKHDHVNLNIKYNRSILSMLHIIGKQEVPGQRLSCKDAEFYTSYLQKEHNEINAAIKEIYEPHEKLLAVYKSQAKTEKLKQITRIANKELVDYNEVKHRRSHLHSY